MVETRLAETHTKEGVVVYGHGTSVATQESRHQVVGLAQIDLVAADEPEARSVPLVAPGEIGDPHDAVVQALHAGWSSFDALENVEPMPPAARAVQQRAEDTRVAILSEAIELFSSRGFDGVSLRTIEANAGVQRGAIACHFASKDGLRRCAIDRVFARFVNRIEALEGTLRDLEPTARLRPAMAAFVRLCAEMPELSRLMVQEGKQASWRLDYIVETYMRPRQAWLTELVGRPLDPHTFYFVVGASKAVFDVEHACRSLFGVDPTSEEFIREHASRLADLLQSAPETNGEASA